MSILKTRRLRRDDEPVVRELVSRLASGEDPRPWPDLERLSESEAVELVELAERINRGDLDRSDRKFWRLVAAASGWDRDHFERRAAEAKAAGKAAEREARERRMPWSRREEKNLLLALQEGLDGDELWVDDAMVVLLVAMQFASGKPLVPTSKIEGSAAAGDLTLFVDVNYGFVGDSDGSSATAGWRQRAAYLAEEGWLQIEGRGPRIRIRFGPRVLGLLDAPVAAEVS
jgi:hypothetical protein